MLTRVLQSYGVQCGATTKLSLAKVGNLLRMRTLLSVWSDGLASLPESLVSIDATGCTNTSSGLDVHVLHGVASIERGVGNAAPHNRHTTARILSQTRTIYAR
jgi:hypothetical protein